MACESYSSHSRPAGTSQQCNALVVSQIQIKSREPIAPTIQAGGGEDDIVPDPEPEQATNSRDRNSADVLNSQRVFKKCSPNNKITLYLGNRDIVVSQKNVGKIHGVVIVEPEFLQNRKIFGQVTLTFRYGREDEEVMGLKFCNEAIMCLAQLYPPHERAQEETKTPLQEALLRRLGPNAHAFTMEVTRLAPPSVQLVPAKEYSGAPIGTSYDVRAYAADRADEKLHRRSTVRMSVRVLQQSCSFTDPLSLPPPPPHANADKPFLLSDGRVELEASLDKAVYCHGDTVLVNVAIHNNSNKTVRRLKVFIVQHVDVCMFSNGKFKNVVAMINSKEECPIGPGSTLSRTYSLNPAKGATKNWIALEDSYSKSTAFLASTVTCTSLDDRNVFAIYVSYYVKIKLFMGAIGGELSMKLPFCLMHSPLDLDISGSTALTEQVLSTPTKTSATTALTADIDIIKELAEDTDT